MTIDEALNRIKDKMACDYNIDGCDTCCISSCEDKNIVIQLTEWLEELKFLRQWKTDVMEEFGKYDCNSVEEAIHNGYVKGVNDFAKLAKEEIYCAESLSEVDIDYVKGQLKQDFH